MMHLLRKYDVAPVGRNDAMFAKNISEATSLGKAVIISETTSFAARQTSLKKPLYFRKEVFSGASDLTRTGDLLITSEMHYRLCYTSRITLRIIKGFSLLVNRFSLNNDLIFPAERLQ